MAHTPAGLISGWGRLQKMDALQARYVAAFIHRSVDPDCKPADFITESFQLSSEAAEWMMAWELADGPARVRVIDSIVRPRTAPLDQPGVAPVSRQSEKKKEPREDLVKSVGRRLLKLNGFAPGERALLAARVHLAESGEPGFQTTDVTRILRQTEADGFNVSNTLTSMTGTRVRVPKLEKAGKEGGWRFTSDGEARVLKILQHDSAFQP
jgi:hypothetical protein